MGQDPLYSQLIELCEAFPTRTKWLFVPTHSVGRMVSDRLVLSGSDWANLRIATPLDIALRMGAPFLVERGIDPSEEGLGAALIMQLLLNLPGNSSYFRPLANHPAMAQSLWSTIRELRMAGIAADQVKRTAFESADKHQEFVALYRAYESHLSASGRDDMATVYEEALKHLDWCSVRAADCWLELPYAIWTPLQRKILDSLPGERLEPAVQAVAGVSMPRRLGHARVTVQSSKPSALSYLLSPEGAKDKSGAIELFHAGGREAEVEEVFRRILKRGCSLDQVEIACASDDYAPLIWEKALRYEWPITLASGLPASLTRPGRAIVAFAEWVQSNFASASLRRLLQSGDIRLGAIDLAPGRAAGILVKAAPAWGRDTYALAIGRLVRRYRKRADDVDLADDHRAAAADRAHQADLLLTWITSLLNSVPTPDATGMIDLQELIDGTADFIANYSSTISALDRAAVAALTGAIAELKSLGPYRCTLGAGLRFLGERVEGLSVGSDRSRPGHLFVSGLAQVGYSGRPHTYVVGLEEGRVFPSATEDPVLLDSERAAISPLLRLSSDRIEEAVFNVIHRLAAASSSSSMCLSYSCRDLREFRPSYPSWLMLQAYRLSSDKSSSSFPELLHALGEPVSCVPASATDALAVRDWWLHGLKRVGDSGRPSVLSQYKSLQDAVNAQAHRESDVFTEFDGHVPDAGIVLDPCRRESPLSATQLEGAAQCPFRYFLERGLQVSAIDDGARDQDVWLDPMTRGSLMHDLFARMMRRCRDEKRRMSAEHDLAWSHAACQETLESLRVEIPPPSAEIYERELKGVLDDLSLFINYEAQEEESRTPLAFEVSFGRPSDTGEALAVADPIVIDLGGGLTFRLAGQIDRIDQVGAAEFEVIDYKTGGFWEDDWKGTFGGATKLQHALYGLAAVEILKRVVDSPRVTKGVYYFTSAKGRQTRKPIPAPSAAELNAVLGDLREVIASGSFVHAADESACKFCDYGKACGAGAHANAESKIETSALLEAYRRMVSHD